MSEMVCGCGCVCVVFLLLQVSSTCPFAPAKVFPKLQELPIRFVSLISPQTESGVLAASWLLSGTFATGRCRSSDSGFQHHEMLFPDKMAIRTGAGREYPSCCTAVTRTAAHLGSSEWVFFFIFFCQIPFKNCGSKGKT